MERSSIDRQAESGPAVLLGPAVSPRRRAGEASPGALAEPLPPFVRPRRAPAPEAEAVAVSPPAAPGLEEASLSEALEELVAAEPEDGLGLVREADWGFVEEPAEQPTAELSEKPPVESAAELSVELSEEPVAELSEGQAAEGAELFREESEELGVPEPEEAPTLEPEEAPTPEAEEPVIIAQAVEAVGAAEEGARGEVVPVEKEPEGAQPAPRVEQALADAVSLEEGPALQEVAGRLERIASALREGRPIELFSSGSSDPLEVLIAGYALGYSEAFRRVSEERRKGQ